MNKIYIFGIGGTGARVIRALTLLLASGVDCGGNAIVPIIIDPDLSAADLTRTVELLKRYSQVREKLDFSQGVRNRFFQTEIVEQVLGFRMPLNDQTVNCKFEDYLGVNSMSEENAALMRMLFSNKNLDSDMKVGFKGNPNIGSVVLNQFQQSQEFQQFASGFQQGDKIFIISSIFGGTGASGFPLLLKTLRHSTRIPNNGLINNAVIGAISVLPYFGVEPDESSAIDSTTFISKTKSALSYYERNISNVNAIDYLYYIADKERNTYENSEGGDTQRNKAHMVELCSALAVIDFARNSEKRTQTQHKEFGTQFEHDPLVFDDLGQETKKMIAGPLTQMSLFAKYMKDCADKSCEKQPWAKDHRLQSQFFNSDFVHALKYVQSDGESGYLEWLDEMSDNKRSFSPFQWENLNDEISIVRGKEVKYNLFGSKGFAYFESKLNEASKKADENYTKEQKLMEFFFVATETIVSKKFNF